MIDPTKLTPELQAEYQADMEGRSATPPPEPVPRDDIGRVEVIDATFTPPNTITMSCYWATGINAGKVFTQTMLGDRSVCDDIVRNIERTAAALEMIAEGKVVDVKDHLGYTEYSEPTGE